MSVIHDNEMHALSEECRTTLQRTEMIPTSCMIAMHWTEVWFRLGWTNFDGIHHTLPWLTLTLSCQITLHSNLIFSPQILHFPQHSITGEYLDIFINAFRWCWLVREHDEVEQYHGTSNHAVRHVALYALWERLSADWIRRSPLLLRLHLCGGGVRIHEHFVHHIGHHLIQPSRSLNGQ